MDGKKQAVPGPVIPMTDMTSHMVMGRRVLIERGITRGEKRKFLRFVEECGAAPGRDTRYPQAVAADKFCHRRHGEIFAYIGSESMEIPPIICSDKPDAFYISWGGRP